MANPLDAHRKQQRKKELKKNKENRKKTREVITVKKDTRPLEADIAKLTSAAQRGPLSASDREELNSLKAELARIMKAKADYVEAHPEHRKFVFPDRGSSSSNASGSGSGGIDPPGLYGKDGKLKDPQRSYYYDPVFNPFGAPPPGMPYRERDPTAEEIAAFQKQLEEQHRQMMAEEESEDDSDEDDDEENDDIVMPAGPPPPKDDAANEGGSDDSTSDEDDDDDIAMPAGPPPPKPNSSMPIPTGPKSSLISRPSIPLPPNPNFHSQNRPPFPPQHQSHFPPPTQPFHPDPAFRNLPPRPSAPMGAPTGPRQPNRPPHKASATVQDPLSDTPQQTFQGYLQARNQQNISHPNPNHISIGSGQTSSSSSATIQGEAQPASFFVGASSGASSNNTTITAAPVIRDLKKEATAFIPSNMRKKKSSAASGTLRAAVNAAPGMGGETGEGAKVERANLLSALKDKGIGGIEIGGTATKKSAAEESKEDYERFKKEMGEFL